MDAKAFENAFEMALKKKRGTLSLFRLGKKDSPASFHFHP
jgi:hypothetical protein